MDIETIRAKIRAKQYSIYKHALVEAFKDGLNIEDILYTALNGEIIETYPERDRCLLYATLPDGMPVHVVIDYGWEEELYIVTVYIPDRTRWIASKIRKLTKRRKKR